MHLFVCVHARTHVPMGNPLELELEVAVSCFDARNITLVPAKAVHVPND